MNRRPISDTGLSVVHEPEQADDAIVDIVFVHGLQGHPFRTWAAEGVHKDSHGHRVAEVPGQQNIQGPSIVRRFNKWRRRHSQMNSPLLSRKDDDKQGADANNKYYREMVFWPSDLLPNDCEKARILTWGYDSNVTKYMIQPTNKSSAYSHGKDLLYALRRERTSSHRPLIFVAHSLGGIVVKEMLNHSSLSEEGKLAEIVKYTFAVIFLGTPHRGSFEFAALGEMARKGTSALLMDTTSTSLDSLGLKNSDLERCQEAFSRTWATHNFRVKTFQEALALTGINLGLLNKKVVPDFSSSLGDFREHSEKLQANHRDMCRFSGGDDPNYQKIAGALRDLYAALPEPTTEEPDVPDAKPQQTPSIPSHLSAFIDSLRFADMESRQRNIEAPIEHTCEWLLENRAYQEWWDRINMGKHHAFLWLKGNPGSGKSTLMNAIIKRIRYETNDESCIVAAFFFNARGKDLEHSQLGMLRSLLYQILRQAPYSLLLHTLGDLKATSTEDSVSRLAEEPLTLKAHLKKLCARPTGAEQTPCGRIVLFVDALDECNQESMRDVAYFLAELSESAYSSGTNLNICISSRTFPGITLTHCSEVLVHNHNVADIELYVDRKLRCAIVPESSDFWQLKMNIITKASGIFLWVVLVVALVLKDRDEGKSMGYLKKRIQTVPEALEGLFRELLHGHGKDTEMMIRLFQWVILPQRPLRLREWHHILAFIREKPPSSLKEWKDSEYFTENDEQLERQLRTISRGLVEVYSNESSGSCQHTGDNNGSIVAGAGSLDQESGETRTVHVIHESVRDFFLKQDGFSILEPTNGSNAIRNGHVSILITCIHYIRISELDALDEARGIMSRPDSASRRPSSVASFSSASSHKARSILGSVDDLNDLSEFKSQNPISLTSVFPFSFSRALRRKNSSNSASPPESAERKEQKPLFAMGGNSFSSTSSSGSAGWWMESVQVLYRHKLKHPERTNGEPISPEANPESTAVSTPGPFYDDAAVHFDENWAASMSDRMTLSSVAGGSRVLEDFAALLDYATTAIVFHARMAEKDGASCRPVLDMLAYHDTWRRWLRLAECDEMSLGIFAAEEGLNSWLEYSLDTGSCPVDAFRAAVRHSQDGSQVLIVQREARLASQPGDRGSMLHRLATISNKRWPFTKLWTTVDQVLDPIAVQSLINARDGLGWTPLHCAIYAGIHDSNMVQQLLSRRASVSALWNGMTPLHVACYCLSDRKFEGVERPTTVTLRRLNIIRLLLASGSDVNARRDHDGWTALHYVCSAWSSYLAEAAQLLLRHGAEPLAKDDNGYTPLHYLVQLDYQEPPEMCAFLDTFMKTRGNIHACTDHKETALHLAAESGTSQAVNRLLNFGADPNVEDETGNTPLHVLCTESERLDNDKAWKQICHDLIHYGANVNARNHHASTPLELLHGTRMEYRKQVLLELGALPHGLETIGAES